MTQVFDLWQQRLDQSGGDPGKALALLGVDPGRAELLARARAESRSPDDRGQLEHAFCWISGVGMGALQTEGREDLSDALARMLQELGRQGLSPLCLSLGLEMSYLSEQAMRCALHSGGNIPPGEKAASCAEGMLTALMASKSDPATPQRYWQSKA